jgi:hypothetical protein
VEEANREVVPAVSEGVLRERGQIGPLLLGAYPPEVGLLDDVDLSTKELQPKTSGTKLEVGGFEERGEVSDEVLRQRLRR